MMGIYKITNKVNGKYYIGSSNDIKRRFGHHKSNLKNNRHSNQYLQNAWNKYGKKQFEFSVIEEVIESDLLIKEQEYLNDALNKNQKIYNISKIAGSPMAGLNHTKQVKKLLSEKLSGENHPHYGKPVSEEWRKKISDSRKRFSNEEEKSFLDRWRSGESKASIAKSIGVHPTTIKRAIDRQIRFYEKNA
jgi:group I intron endonuclease